MRRAQVTQHAQKHTRTGPAERLHMSSQICQGGGFKHFLIFTPTWGIFPFCLIFFKWVETTNQLLNVVVYLI